MNVLTVTGNLGNDCRVGNVGGTAVVNFSLAVKSGYGDKAQTIWVDVALWGKQAESRLKDYLLKGQQVAVSGEMGTREHEGKTYITLRANSVDLVGSRDSAAPQPQQPQQPQQAGYGQQPQQPTPQPTTYGSFDTPAPQQQATSTIDDSDIPF